jgi:hypothetical protein
MGATPIPNYLITPHAAFEMQRRGLDEALVRSVLSAPEQRATVRAGREVLQSRKILGPRAKPYLIRVFVDVDRNPAEVVTVYKTSKVAKYWEADA